MKILFCCFNPRSISNIHYGFKQAGCETKNLFFDYGYENRTELLIKNLEDAIDSFKPHIVYTYGWWAIGIDLSSFLNCIRRKGIFHVYWAYDDPPCFHNISFPAARGCHLVFTTAVECIKEYVNRGIRAYILPHAAFTQIHRKVPGKKEYQCDIALMANNYNMADDKENFSFRLKGVENILKPLVEGLYNLKVWGLWWDNWDRAYVLPRRCINGFLKPGNEAIVYGSSKIALGFQSVDNSSTHISVRTFEALACGIFHISQYSQALKTYFKKGIHMEWSDSPEETLELVNFYLHNEDERNRIALEGQREVYEKHTLYHRAKTALEVISKYI